MDSLHLCNNDTGPPYQRTVWWPSLRLVQLLIAIMLCITRPIVKIPLFVLFFGNFFSCFLWAVNSFFDKFSELGCMFQVMSAKTYAFSSISSLSCRGRCQVSYSNTNGYPSLGLWTSWGVFPWMCHQWSFPWHHGKTSQDDIDFDANTSSRISNLVFACECTKNWMLPVSPYKN